MALVAMFLALSARILRAAETKSPSTNDRGGRNFIATRVFSAEDDARVLKAFEGLRVADVTDGMDFVGLKNIGLMDPEIRPLWMKWSR
mgnify:CR=1 FL=1